MELRHQVHALTTPTARSKYEKIQKMSDKMQKVIF
jgi:hypothetical protein